MKKNAIINNLKLSLLLTFVLIISGLSSFALNDTTYHHFFEYKGVPYQWNLIKKLNATVFELSLSGNKLNIEIDSSNVAKGGEKQLKIIDFDTNITTSSTRNLPFDFTLEQFRAAAISIFVTHNNSVNIANTDLTSLFSKGITLLDKLSSTYQEMKAENVAVVMNAVKKDIETATDNKIREINKGHKKTIDSLADIIDIVDEEHQYGGQFEFADMDSSGIIVYRPYSKFYDAKDSANVDSTDNQSTKDKTGKPKFKSRDFIPFDTSKVKFFPTKIFVKTFNNFIDLLHVDGFVSVNGKRYKTKFYNGDNSIALKDLYLRERYLAFRIPFNLLDSSKSSSANSNLPGPALVGNDSLIKKNSGLVDFRTYLVNISDLIQLDSYRNNLTFMAKNNSYLLSRRDSIVPYQRRSFYDYLNFTTFLDFLGVVEKTPNSLIQLDGRIRLPIRLVNFHWGKKSMKYKTPNVWLPKIDVYLNAAFINGSQAESRAGSIFNQSSISSKLDSLYIDNFDLVRKNNIRTGLELGLLKKEMKSNNLNFYLDYGLHFFRTNLSYTILDTAALDTQQRFNAWSWTHGPIARFEYRPDLNLGMDLSFAYNMNQHITNSDNDNLTVLEIKGPLNRNLPPLPSPIKEITASQRANYKLEFNVYFMTKPRVSNGGLYFRISNYFSYNFKQFFPQVLVGYSTRLSGMIKNISNKSE